MAILLEVARSAAENDAENASDVRDIIVRNVQIYFRNETHAFQHPKQCTREDVRAMVPFDTDVVQLYAVIWARLAGEKEYKPYCGSGYVNDQLFFGTGTKFGPASKKPEARPDYKLGLMWKERLKFDIPKLLAWPWADRKLEFDWQELVVKARKNGTTAVKIRQPDGTFKMKEDDPQKFKMEDVAARKYSYESSPKTLRKEKAPEGWTYVLEVPEEIMRLPAGTRRFRVVVKLPNGVRRNGNRSGPLVSHGEKSIEKGMALRVSVRRSDTPRYSPEDDEAGRGPRSKKLEEMLRWATAFINTPYENGGIWFGGKGDNDKQPQHGWGSAGYQGYGMDCNGFINTVAYLAGIEWPALDSIVRNQADCTLTHPHEGRHKRSIAWPKNWRRVTLARQGSNPRYRFPGVKITADELRPGDLLDNKDHSHVRLVWRVWKNEDKVLMVNWIESAGTPNKARLHPAGSPASVLAEHYHFINMNDPKSRHAETKA